MAATHLESIGFFADNEEDLNHWLELALQDSRRVDLSAGRYYLWSPGNGIELWMQAGAWEGAETIIGFTPYFRGASRVRLALTRRVMEHPDTRLDGGFYGWVNGEIDQDGEASGLYPLIFEAPDYGMHHDLRLPAVIEVQLTAFAHEAHVFRDGEEMRSSGQLELQMADEAFFPSGTFGLVDNWVDDLAEQSAREPAEPGEDPAEEGAPRPTQGRSEGTGVQPSAFFTGQVLQARQVLNSLTGEDFYWLLVKTLGCQLDVVVSPSLLKRLPRPGEILFCDGCIFGRLH